MRFYWIHSLSICQHFGAQFVVLQRLSMSDVPCVTMVTHVFSSWPSWLSVPWLSFIYTGVVYPSAFLWALRFLVQCCPNNLLNTNTVQVREREHILPLRTSEINCRNGCGWIKRNYEQQSRATDSIWCEWSVYPPLSFSSWQLDCFREQRSHWPHALKQAFWLAVGPGAIIPAERACSSARVWRVWLSWWQQPSTEKAVCLHLLVFASSSFCSGLSSFLLTFFDIISPVGWGVITFIFELWMFEAPHKQII